MSEQNPSRTVDINQNPRIVDINQNDTDIFSEENDEMSFLSKFLKDNNVLAVEKNITTERLVSTIIEKNNTSNAFYVIDLGEVSRKYKLWTELFPHIKPFFAVKSNPNLVICKLLGRLGCGFDVASVNEINLVKDIVSDMNQIIYANPIKSSESIQYARTVDVDTLVFDSETELYKIKLYHEDARLVLRIKVDDSASACKFSEKFGADKSEIEDLLKLAKNMNLNVIGISWHVGSNCSGAELYYSAIEDSKYAFDIAEKIGFFFNFLDIGGGFTGLSDEKSMSLLSDISSCVSNALSTFFSEYNYDESDSDKKQLNIISEPGRMLVTSSHTLVINVIGRKEKFLKSEKVMSYYVNDGIYSSFNCINYDHQKPELVPYNNDEIEKFKSVVFGHTCDSIDTVVKDVFLPKLAIGDKLYIENFGAYTLASSSTFNGFSVADSHYVLS